MYYVYILQCNNGDYYKGCTSDLKERISRHQAGQVPATVKNRPLRLLFYAAFTDKYKAFAFEKYLKSGSGTAFLKKRFV